MFSKRLFKILGFRTFIMQLGYTSPFRWDFATKRLVHSPMYPYWNFKIYTFYLIMYGILLGIRLAQKSILKHNAILGEDETGETKHRLEPAIMALDIAFIAIIVCISSILVLIAEFKDQMIEFFNEMVDFDTFLEETFRTNLKSQEKLYKRTSLVIELLIMMIAVSTLIIPVMFGFFFLQDTEPLHRFFAEVLEVEIKPELKCLPQILFVIWSILQCCNVAGLFLSIGVMYMKFVLFWLTALHPTKILRGGVGRGSQVKYVTSLGLLDEQTMIKMYRTHQVLNKMFNKFMANRLLSNHQAGIQVIIVVCCLISIQYFEEMLYTPGYQVVFLGIFLSLVIVYVETKIVSDAITAGDEFRGKIRSLTGRNKEVVKCVVSSWSLKIHVAYPYFTVNRETFLEFVHRTVEFLVDALMAD
ncbi:unnamed protein product [Orchesella dallaii]|uniref:Odorant receptor n=1 Tax=Orchesella dallaii TaxID=48710 RepID=A0ABP1QVT9_9HEXA